MAGHKDCPKTQTFNLYGLAAHRYKNCPKREKTWASVTAKAPAKMSPTLAQAQAASKPKDKPAKKKGGKRTPAQTPSPIPPSPEPDPPIPVTPTEAVSFSSVVLSFAPLPLLQLLQSPLWRNFSLLSPQVSLMEKEKKGTAQVLILPRS